MIIRRQMSEGLRWEQVDQLFHLVLEQADADRAAMLSRLGESDPMLCQEVIRLLDLHARAESFLEEPAIGGRLDGAFSASFPQHSPGEQVGRFRLVRLLDSGGMGDVWLAERADDQFQQSVALKVFRPGASSAQGIQRFIRERQTLARLEHPSIARLIDGGTTEAGTPYLVMEWVQGLPIDQHCTVHRLTRQERVELFRLVCDAVHFAHQNLIVHRDLKPANILVTPAGRPKLLDFGIAQWMSASQESGSELAASRGLCTLDYASPEQLCGGTCTTASDVYSLGIVLHGLLVGTAPRRVAGPLTQMKTSSESVAAASPEVVLPAGDDLGWILRKALQADPARRYATASELSDDLQRWLTAYPVSARPGGSLYAGLRFFQRNRVFSIAAILLAATMLIAFTATSLAWQRTRQERDSAQAATRFIGSVLTTASPFARQAQLPDQSSTDVLRATSRRAAEQLRDLPEVEIQVRLMLAQTHASLWQWTEAGFESRRALDLMATAFGISDALKAQCLTLLGRAQTWLHEHEAVATQRDALALRMRLHGPDHVDVAESSINLGFALWRSGVPDQGTEAETYYRRGLDTYRRLNVTCSSDVARALFSFASFIQEHGASPQEHQSLIRDAAHCYAQLPDLPDRYHVGARCAHAQMLLAEGRTGVAVAEMNALLRITPPELDVEATFRQTLWTLALLESQRDNRGVALHAFRRALRGECLSRVSHDDGQRSWLALALMFQAARSVEELLAAIRLMTPLLESGEASPALHLVAAAASLGIAEGRGPDVRDLVTELLRIQEQRKHLSPLATAVLRGVLAEEAWHAGRTAPALQEWMRAYRQVSSVVSDHDALVQPIISGLVRANEAMGRRAAANHYRSLLITWN